MKKKRLGKLSLDTMAHSFQTLSEEQIRQITGGDGFVSAYEISGGAITNWSYDGSNYAVFIGDDGRGIVLENVHVGSNTLPFQQSDTACYINGEIRIGSGWDDFSFSDLMHEYGHHLQEEKSGSLSFLYNGAKSAYDIWKNDGVGHSDMSFEQEATSLGNSYATSYYDYPKSY